MCIPLIVCLMTLRNGDYLFASCLCCFTRYIRCRQPSEKRYQLYQQAASYFTLLLMIWRLTVP